MISSFVSALPTFRRNSNVSGIILFEIPLQKNTSTEPEERRTFLNHHLSISTTFKKCSFNSNILMIALHLY